MTIKNSTCSYLWQFTNTCIFHYQDNIVIFFKWCNILIMSFNNDYYVTHINNIRVNTVSYLVINDIWTRVRAELDIANYHRLQFDMTKLCMNKYDQILHSLKDIYSKVPIKRYKCFSLEPEGFLYPAVHVALHVEPWRLEPADRLLVPLRSLMSLQVLVPGLSVLQAVCQF